MNKIRVLHSLSAVATGGVERRRLELVKGLDPSRFEQRIMARESMGSLPEQFRAAGAPVSVLGMGRLVAPLPLLKAIAIARSFRPHIVHGAVFEGLPPAILAGRSCGAKVVLEETSHATNRSPRGHALFRTLVALSDACVAISPAVGAYLEEVTRVPKRKIEVIPNGVALPSRSGKGRGELRDELGVPRDAFVIGTVGRLNDDTHKRVSDLLRAAALLRDSHPDVFWLVVGDGPQRTQIEALSGPLGALGKVRFVGQRDDIGDVMEAMDVFALVSAREGFGLALVEAMMCERPVIATAVGGILDIVKEGSGLLVAPCAPDEIAGAVLRLKSDPVLRQELANQGKRRALTHFSARRYLTDVARFYERVVEL